MIKYIWEYEMLKQRIMNIRDAHVYNEVPCQTKMEVVYENEEYYYCKIDGINLLRCVRRSIVDDCFSPYYSQEIDLTAQSTRFQIVEKETKIKQLEFLITEQETSIYRNISKNKTLKEVVTSSRLLIDELEKEIVLLKDSVK